MRRIETPNVSQKAFKVTYVLRETRFVSETFVRNTRGYDSVSVHDCGVEDDRVRSAKPLFINVLRKNSKTKLKEYRLEHRRIPRLTGTELIKYVERTSYEYRTDLANRSRSVKSGVDYSNLWKPVFLSIFVECFFHVSYTRIVWNTKRTQTV